MIERYLTLFSLLGRKNKKQRRDAPEHAAERPAAGGIDLDYSDLAKNTVTQLRQFCRDRKLAVVGRRKQEFISAITAYLAANTEEAKPAIKQESRDKAGSKKTLPEATDDILNEIGAMEVAEQPGEKPLKENAQKALVGMDKMSRLEYQEQIAIDVR